MDLVSKTPRQLLAEARAEGLAVLAQGDRLIVRGPPDAELDLVQTLLRRKAELMPLLAEDEAAERECYEERAAIAEYDGGLRREEAERLARKEQQCLRLPEDHVEAHPVE